jgi:hypothetical protein
MGLGSVKRAVRKPDVREVREGGKTRMFGLGDIVSAGRLEIMGLGLRLRMGNYINA